MLFQQEKWGHIWNSWLNRYFPPCVVLDIYSPTQLIVSRIGAQNVYCVQLNPQQLYYKFQGDRGVRRKGTLKWVSGSLELTSIQLGENSGSLPNLWKLIFCRNASASNLGQNMVAVFLKKGHQDHQNHKKRFCNLPTTVKLSLEVLVCEALKSTRQR